MQGLLAGLVLLGALAGCGDGSTLPSRPSASVVVAGTWTAAFSVSSTARALDGSRLSGGAVRTPVRIDQSGSTVTGQFDAMGLNVSFSGQIDGRLFSGTVQLTNGSGCTTSVPFEGTVAPDEVEWSARVMTPDCGGWAHVVQLQLTARQG